LKSSHDDNDDDILRIKLESRQQLFDNELESYRIRLTQSANEKDDLLKNMKSMEKKYKDIQIKSDVNEQTLTKLKLDMSDKQRKVN
jgi:hypothetical protein